MNKTQKPQKKQAKIMALSFAALFGITLLADNGKSKLAKKKEIKKSEEVTREVSNVRAYFQSDRYEKDLKAGKYPEPTVRKTINKFFKKKV